MSDRPRAVFVCAYSLRGWQERVQVHFGRTFNPFSDEWRPAGTLAANVLGWPTRRPSVEPWAHRIHSEAIWRQLRKHSFGSPTEEDRLRAAVSKAIWRRMRDEDRLFDALSVKGSPSQVEQERLEYARRFAETFPQMRPRLPVNWVPLAPNILEHGDAMLLAFGRDEQHFFTTPAAAVCLSVVVGFARGTLRLCERCARFDAFPREGFQRKYCDRCRDLRESRFPAKGRAADLAADKLARWERVSARVYRRILRESQADRGRARWETTGRLRKKRPMSPKARARWDEWQLLAWNALLVAQDLDAWETEFAPEQKRGPKLMPRRKQESRV